MNDKSEGTPSPFGFAPAPEAAPVPEPSPISPSNFGARPAPSNPAPTVPTSPTPSLSNTPAANPNATGNPFLNPATAATPGANLGTTPDITPNLPDPTTGVSEINAASNLAGAASTPETPTISGTTPGAATTSGAPDAITNTFASTTPGPLGNATATSGAANTISAPNTPGAPNTPEAANTTSAPNTPGTSTPATTPTTPGSPLDRPMTKAAPATPAPSQKKPKKLGLIIGGAVAAGVTLLAIVIAVLAINLNRPNPVTAAVNKILTGQAPANVQVKGNINLSLTDSAPFYAGSNCNLAVNATVTPASLVNETVLTLSCDGSENYDGTTLQLSEIYPGNGDVYLNVDGINTFLENLALAQNTQTTAEDEEATDEEATEDEESTEDDAYLYEDDTAYITGAEEEEEIDPIYTEEGAEGEIVAVDTYALFPDDEVLALLALIGQNVDGEWLKISATSETDETAVDPETVLGIAGTTDCNASLVNTLRVNTNTIAELYRKNPFIESTDEGVTLASKNYPVYKVTLDRTNYTAFLDGVKSAGLFDDYNACVGDKASSLSDTLVDDLYNLPTSIPTLYVEVDSNNNFSRLYWTTRSDDLTATYDLSFSYPATVNVSEPVEYTDIQDVFQWIFGTNYSDEELAEGETVVEGTEVTEPSY